VVDTGANSSAISPALAATLGISPAPDAKRARVHGVTGVVDVPTVRIRSLRADRIERTDFDAPVLAGGALMGTDGIFGVDALEGRRLLVDFRSDRIEIGPADRVRPLSGAVRIKGRLRFGQLLMARARVGKVPVAVVIDSGAERSIGNRALLDALRGSRSGIREIGDIAFDGATGQVRTGRLIYLPQLAIAGMEIVGLPTIISDAYVFDLWGLASEPAILIGMDALGQARAMAIDYKRAELQLVLPLAPAATPVTSIRR
jgi:predicted aspartyl protease